MDFFEQQEQARRKTKWLGIYFAAAVLAIVAAVYVICAVFILVAQTPTPSRFEVIARGMDLAVHHPSAFLRWIWRPDWFFYIGGATLALITAGSAYQTWQLAGGGPVIATLLGGRRLNLQPADPDEQKLRHVVEEMAIASGTPVPEIYVLDDEPGINAFAAGHSSGDTVIGATHGCLKLLNREELQGVVAHEFSHILNGDMRMNMRMIGLLHGILCIALVGQLLMRLAWLPNDAGMGSPRRERGRLPPVSLLGLVLLGAALCAVGYLGVFCGRLIKGAICRQREFLADAAAVQFTRHPDGLVNALKKIGGFPRGSRLYAGQAETASHLFFSNGLGRSFVRLLSTHPSLAERIRVMDPTFDGRFPKVAEPPLTPGEVENLKAHALELMIAQGVHPDKIMARSGQPSAQQLRHAVAVRAAVPPTVRQAAGDPAGAVALVYALLLSREATAREDQWKGLAPKTEPAVAQEVRQLAESVGSMDPLMKLPLLDLAIPALRQLSREQYARFMQNVQDLVESDRTITLFEYTLQKILFRHLRSSYETPVRPTVQFHTLKPLASDCAVLLSALARMGEDDPAEAERAFRQGIEQLDLTGVRLDLMELKDCNLPQIDAALNRFAQAAPMAKKNLLYACAHTVAADGKVQAEEAELVRAIADALDCPVPPLVEDLEDRNLADRDPAWSQG